MHFGHNAVWPKGSSGGGSRIWNQSTNKPVKKVVKKIARLKPGILGFAGGTRGHRYRFEEAIGPVEDRCPHLDEFTDNRNETGYELDEFVGLLESDIPGEGGAEVSSDDGSFKSN